MQPDSLEIFTLYEEIVMFESITDLVGLVVQLVALISLLMIELYLCACVRRHMRLILGFIGEAGGRGRSVAEVTNFLREHHVRNVYAPIVWLVLSLEMAYSDSLRPVSSSRPADLSFYDFSRICAVVWRNLKETCVIRNIRFASSKAALANI